MADSTPNPSYSYACEECGKAFTNMEELTAHRERAHSKSLGTAVT